MEERIYKNIKTYIDNYVIISKYGLSMIFDLYVNLNGLSEYAKYLKFDDTIDSLGSYGDNRILYNYEKTLNAARKHSDSIYGANLFMVHNLLHELKHAEQERIRESYKKNPKQFKSDSNAYECAYELLLFDSHLYFTYEDEDFRKSPLFKDDNSSDLHSKFIKLYNDNHDIFPEERFADLDAFNFLKKLIYKYETNEECFKKYLDFIDSLYYIFLVKEYNYDSSLEYMVSPVEEFINKFHFEDRKTALELLRKSLIKVKPYDKKTLMYLGLKVDCNSFKHLLDYCLYLNDLDNSYTKSESEDNVRHR